MRANTEKEGSMDHAWAKCEKHNVDYAELDGCVCCHLETIDQLRAENARYREALKSIGKEWPSGCDLNGADAKIFNRIARAALNPEDNSGKT